MEEGVQFLELLNGRIAYRKLGNGPRCLVAIHGFGRDGADFLPSLACEVADYYTCYLIDLPFHGQSRWDEPYFMPSDLRYIIRRLVGKRPFEGVGHSLGARLWIALLRELDPQPERLHLIAPDGIGSAWGSFTEHMPVGLRNKSERWLKQPTRFLRFANLLHEWGLIDKFALRYLQVQLATEASRARLFATWQSLVHFRMNKYRAQQLLAGELPVDVYLGQRDHIVPPNRINTALEGLAGVKLHELDCGHWDIVRQWQPLPHSPSI